nr:MAG TPA: hypothetical protein [Caudoviricetes sp.]
MARAVRCLGSCTAVRLLLLYTGVFHRNLSFFHDVIFLASVVRA